MEDAMATATPDNVVEVMREVALKHLGRAKPPRRRLPKEWMSLQVKARHRGYRQAARRHRRCRMQDSKTAVKEAHTAFRRALRRAKRRADKEQALEVEGGRKRVWSFVESKKGAAHQTRLVSDVDETLQFWRQQFNDDEPLTEGDHTPNAQPVVYTEVEINMVIREMADKAPGEDGIRVLLLKAVNSTPFRQELARVFTMITNAPGAVPQWMRRGLGKLIYKKKGSRKDPGNYRPIILAPVLAKVYEKLLEMKGRTMVVNSQLQVALEQGGFMANRSTFDSVFLVECVRDAQIAASRPLYAAFLDMKKAFDSVNHNKLLRVLQEQPGVDRRWIRALHNILVNRQMKLFDVYVSMLQGTAQGSPISPLLFIAFVNPLIERLRACTGVRLTDDRIIRGLFFADDICLLAESMEDMRRMIAVCEEWAEEFGMTFNAGKSEMMQLAGRISQQRPEVVFAGGVLKWVTQFKYLGVPITQGRRKPIPLPEPQLWQSYHRVKDVLRGPYPLLDQLMLIKATMMNVALYPAAVRDVDYDALDRFLYRSLIDMTRCPWGRTSAKFLRAELGLLPSKFMGHIRALNFLWHIRRKAWFRHYLPYLRGPGSYNRLLGIAAVYNIDVALVDQRGKEEWDALVKSRVQQAAAAYMSRQLEDRELPAAEARMQCRRYVRLGGCNARYGVRFRWDMLCHRHPRWAIPLRQQQLAVLPRQQAFSRCDTCQRWHRPTAATMGEGIRCSALIDPSLRKIRKRALQAVEAEADRSKQTKGSTFPPAITEQVVNLQWRRQSAATTKTVLGLVRRVALHRAKEDKRAAG
jgi:hypothetical protein